MSKKVRRLNNEGMTLVELLVALVILAVVVVPLLHTFISAANINLKSRKRLKVTTIAQDVMEGIKANSLEEMAYQFNYPEGFNDGIIVNDSFQLLSVNLIKNGNAGIHEARCSIGSDGAVSGYGYASDVYANTGVHDDAPCILSTDAGKTYEFDEKENGKYYFSLEDVMVDVGDDNNKKDIIIAVDASKYRKNPSVATTSPDRLNSLALVDISSMNPENNAVCAEPFELVEDAVNEINFLNSTSYSKDDLSKKINVDITKVAGGDVVNVNVDFIFSVDGYSYTRSFPCFDNAGDTSNELTGLYLFYYPNYNYVTGNKDLITINNDSYLDITMYLTKQQRKGVGITDSSLQSDENNYRCNVEINETGVSVSNKHIKLRSNLDYNLYDTYNFTSAPGIMGTKQAEFKYNGIVKQREDLLVESLGGEKIEDRLYEAKVYVYKEGSLASARTGSGNISADNLLYELDGSIKK